MDSTTTWDAMNWLFVSTHRVLSNIAPERNEELKSIITDIDKWELRRSYTEAQFYAVPEDKAIYLSGAGQASLWCLSYVAFHIMDKVSRAQRAPCDSNAPYVDIGIFFAENSLGDYITFAKRLVHADCPWPCNLLMPKSNAKEDSIEWRINNIYLGALSWILLHEVGHIYHGDQKFVPSNISRNQEFKADGFATKWILDEAGQGLQREFRILMIAVALTWLFLYESEKRGPGTTHPPTILRFREVVQHFEVGERSVGLENAIYLFKAILDPSSEPPKHETPREAFEWISQRLEELFPV